MEKRQLAVIVFADIADYTALMQEDEKAALSILNRFNEIIERETPNHGGQVVQFFGDGALLAFDSASKALACAVVMQEEFRVGPQVPVRIGMHLGDVLFKDGNVFGDGVNVASRIESLGTPRSILVSKVIRDQVKNKENYQLASLGSFEFKNVKEPVGVYALAKPGFVVPKRSDMQGKLKKRPSKSISVKLLLPILLLAVLVTILWASLNSRVKNILPEEIRQEKVAVAVFYNGTNDSELDAFGNMASDWITAGLRELKVKTTSPEIMRRYQKHVSILPNDPTGKISLLELTDARYVVTGRYYEKNNDSIQIISRLESTETGDVVYDFPTMSGPKNNIEDLIKEIGEQFKGYWAVKGGNKLSLINPPKYEAYRAFLDCSWLNIDCTKNVLAIDSTYLWARVNMAYMASFYEDDSLYRSVSTYVKQHWDKCTEFEKNYFNFAEHSANGDYQAAQLAIEKNYQMNPKNRNLIHESAVYYTVLNQPENAVNRYKEWFDNYDTLKDLIFGSSYPHYFFSLNQLGQHDQVIDFLKNHPDVPIGIYQLEMIRAFMIKQDVEAIRNLEIDFQPDLHLLLAHAFNVHFSEGTANIFAQTLRDNLHRYQDPGKGRYYLRISNYLLINLDSKATAHYVLKEWEETEKILLALRSFDWKTYSQDAKLLKSWLYRIDWHMSLWVEGFLGCTYARQGKVELAELQIDKLETFRETYPKLVNRYHRGVIDYWQARIHAILGSKVKAMELLRRSFQKGRNVEPHLFIYDWDLKNLEGYPPYEELIRPQELK